MMPNRLSQRPCRARHIGHRSLAVVGWLGLLAFQVSRPVDASTIPHNNDFATSGFTYNSSPAFSGPTGGTITRTVTGSSPATTHGVEQFTNAASQTFTLETRFRVNPLKPFVGDSTVGFAAFGTTSGLSNSGSDSYLLADFTFASDSSPTAQGRVRLIKIASPNASIGTDGSADDYTTGTSPDPAKVAVQVGTWYILRLNVVAKGSDKYDLTLSVLKSDGTQVGTSATATNQPFSGQYFGLRDRFAGGPNATDTTTVEHDYFRIDVPEPTMLPLVAGLVLLARRRRASRH